MSAAAELDWLQAGVARGDEPRHSRRADPAINAKSIGMRQTMNMRT